MTIEITRHGLKTINITASLPLSNLFAFEHNSHLKLATHTLKAADTWRIRNLCGWWPNWNWPIEGFFFLAMFSSASKAALGLHGGFALAFGMVFAECLGFVW